LAESRYNLHSAFADKFMTHAVPVANGFICQRVTPMTDSTNLTMKGVKINSCNISFSEFII